MRPLLLLLLAVTALAQPTITDIQATQNRAAIFVDDGGANYAPGLCSIRVCQTTNSTCATNDAKLVYDITPTLFSGSNLDNRTVSWNGVNRSTNVINGRQHIFVVGTPIAGWDIAAAPSRALEVVQRYWAIPTCNSVDGAGRGFSTANIPLGDGHPSPPVFDSRAPWNLSVPKLDHSVNGDGLPTHSGRQTKYINPTSGVAEYQVTNRLDNVYESGLGTFPTAADPTSSWTSIANLKSGNGSGSFATISATGQSHAAKLTGWAMGSCDPTTNHYGFKCSVYNVDLSIQGTGVGSPTISACLSNNLTSNQCDSVTLTTAAFSGTLATNRINPSFPSGTSFYNGWTALSGHVIDPYQLAYTGGVLIWMATGTSASINVSFDHVLSNQFISLGPPNAEVSFCGPPATLSGDRAYLCMGYLPGGTNALYVITPSPAAHPSNMNINLISVLYDTVSNQWMTVGDGSFDFIGGNPNKILGIGASDGKFYTGTINSYNTYTPRTTTANPPPADGNITWTVASNPTSIVAQILASSAPSNTGKTCVASNLGSFQSFIFKSFVNGGVYWQSSASGGLNDTIVVMAFTDSTNTLTGSLCSVMMNGSHYGVPHYGQIGADPYQGILQNPNGAFSGSPYDYSWSAGLAGALVGPFEADFLQYKTGSTWHDYVVTSGVSATVGASTVIPATANGLEYYLDSANGGPGKLHAATVIISGGTGDCTAINARWKISAQATNTFTIPFASTGLTGCTNLTVKSSRPYVQSYVDSMTCGGSACSGANHANPLVSTNGVAHLLINGDPIGFGNAANDFVTQFYAKTTGCTGCDATHFALFKDAALTVAADWTTDNLTAGQNDDMVYFAEACPSVGFTIPFDVNPSGQIRCRTIRVTEPQNRFASTAEHNAFPPVCNTGVATWDAHLSYVQDISVGETIMDYTGPWKGNNSITGGDKAYVIKVVKNSSCDVEVTLAHFWPWFSSGVGIPAIVNFNDQLDTHNNNFNYGDRFNTSVPGWSPAEEPSYGMHNFGLIDTTDPTMKFNPVFIAYGDGHPDLFGNSTNFRWTEISCNPFNGTVATFLTLVCPNNINASSTFMDGGSNNLQLRSGTGSYHSVRQFYAPSTEQVWSTNTANLGGCGDSQFDGPCHPFDAPSAPSPASGTSTVYSTGVPPAQANVTPSNIEYVYKTFGINALAGWYTFNDISNTTLGNTITDSTLYSLCVVLVAGQCRSGSTKGQIYIELPAAPNVLYTVDLSGACHTNTISILTPCVFSGPSTIGWAYQWVNVPPDVNGRGSRKITSQFMSIGAGTSYPPFPVNSGGEFGVYPQCDVDGDWRCEFFISKLPPWPGNRVGTSGFAYDRTKWFPLKLGGTGSSNEEYQFGYIRYGNATDFLCTPYNDICTSKIPTSTSDPFGYVATDSFTASSCPCVINAVPGEILYYRYHDIAGGKYGPTQVLAVP